MHNRSGVEAAAAAQPQSRQAAHGACWVFSAVHRRCRLSCAPSAVAANHRHPAQLSPAVAINRRSSCRGCQLFSTVCRQLTPPARPGLPAWPRSESPQGRWRPAARRCGCCLLAGGAAVGRWGRAQGRGRQQPAVAGSGSPAPTATLPTRAGVRLLCRLCRRQRHIICGCPEVLAALCPATALRRAGLGGRRLGRPHAWSEDASSPARVDSTLG